jgi:TfoX N-terminal domain
VKLQRTCSLVDMARDAGLEELVSNALGELPGVSGKAMFGGWAFLLYGNLLCGVRRGSLMLRVGRDNEEWALAIPGVDSVVMRGRRMQGYVRVMPEAYGEDGVRQRLVEAAVRFTGTLARK